MMISYAQNREDVLLGRAFPGPTGFYVDVGAADPVEYSVTKHFYDRGWSGINVEPQPGYFAALAAARPRDTNLNLGVSNAPGSLTLFEAPTHPGWSSMDPAAADQLRAKGIAVAPRTVPVRTLSDVLAEHAKGRTIDFLKVDVEGHEPQVLAGADLARWRPRVVVVEATEVNDSTPNFAGWEPAVLAAGYHVAFFDGLNRYYVRAEDAHLAAALQVPANVLDRFEGHEFVAERAKLKDGIAFWSAAFDRRTRETEILAAHNTHLQDQCDALARDLDATRRLVPDSVRASAGYLARALKRAVRGRLGRAGARA